MTNTNMIAEKLLEWYGKNARVLPWRDVKDPYKVWISEIMLQQTRVETVIPYYERWMELFPTIEVLAAADLQQVLHTWEGLGYYSRARKISETARLVAAELGGVFPRSVEGLEKLPGIGPYTAAAIASFAFDQDTLPVDGNLSRVLSRLFDIGTELGSKEFLGEVRRVGMEILPAGRSSDFNQALMDLGSSICLPSSPKCAECPLAAHCGSIHDPESRPVRVAVAAIPTRSKLACAAKRGELVLIVKRPEKGLLGGLWEFPAVECPEGDLGQFVAEMKKVYSLDVVLMREVGKIKHTYSHFHVMEGIWVCSVGLVEAGENTAWVAMEDLHKYPMGKVDRSIARLLLRGD